MKIADAFVTAVVIVALWKAGAGWWSLLVLPYSCWEYLCGMLHIYAPREEV